MKTKLTFLPLIAITAHAISTGSASAQCSNNSLVTYAHNIENVAAKLQNEFRVHYAHSGAYRHLMADIARVRAEARHIDQLSHNPYSSLHHINADLTDLDRLAHHLHAVVDAVERGRYSGHVDGDTRHVHTMLTSLNGNIHNMKRVVAAYARPVHYDHHDHHGHGSFRSNAVNSIIRSVLSHHGH